jgi:hypothetical protein
LLDHHSHIARLLLPASIVSVTALPPSTGSTRKLVYSPQSVNNTSLRVVMALHCTTLVYSVAARRQSLLRCCTSTFRVARGPITAPSIRSCLTHLARLTMLLLSTSLSLVVRHGWHLFSATPFSFPLNLHSTRSVSCLAALLRLSLTLMTALCGCIQSPCLDITCIDPNTGCPCAALYLQLCHHLFKIPTRSAHVLSLPSFTPLALLVAILLCPGSLLSQHPGTYQSMHHRVKMPNLAQCKSLLLMSFVTKFIVVANRSMRVSQVPDLTHLC